MFETSEAPAFCGCKVDPNFFVESTEALAETYTRQVMNEKSDISGIDETMDACKIVVRALDGLRAGEPTKSWKVPTGPPLVQMHPSHITQFLLTILVDPSLL